MPSFRPGPERSVCFGTFTLSVLAGHWMQFVEAFLKIITRFVSAGQTLYNRAGSCFMFNDGVKYVSGR